MDFKQTLNLPKTDFSMKANLTEKEQTILKKWAEENIHQKLRSQFSNSPKYILHDGPPYANGNIHIGHALNKILKDIILKSKTMKGFNTVYVPGWDCHGLPIEHQVDKKLGEKKDIISKEKKRKLCRDYANKFIDIQREEFKRLGIFGDWDNPYLTMDYEYEAAIIQELGKFAINGNLYQGLKPIHWCTSCKTALAEAEVEYDEHKSPSVYVKFPMKSDIAEILPSLKGKKVSVVIWTTTPWTLPANLAIALHPAFEYAAVEADGEVIILAKELLEEALNKFGISKYAIIETFIGSRLEGLKCTHPLIDRESLIILSHYVTLEVGTGCVHTAPGHGQEDYEIGLKYGLEVYSPVDNDGRFVKEVSDFGGMYVFEANKVIKEKLKELGYLLAEEEIVHSYPHCWRCKNPVIFRATKQWFISMDKNDLRKKTLEEIKKVQWIPEWGQDRIYGMVENRPDWCISRQRSWGVPITVFYCKNCRQFLVNQEIVDHITNLVRKEGVDIWFTKEAHELMPSETRCPQCNGSEFEKEMDILDVWFDSGVSQAAVLEQREDLTWPADMYLEGSDQHRGWFQSAILTAVGTRAKAPYKAVLTHGFVVDAEGKKMSKSAGNVISPQEIIKKYGAEIVRLWVSAEDYKDDIRISNEIVVRLAEAYRKIRNTARYILGNLYDFDPRKNKVAYQDLMEIDKWAIYKLQKLIARLQKAYDTYEFYVVFHSLLNFCAVDMSSFYLDVLKDSLYTEKADSLKRRSAQTAMFEILIAMVKLMAPVLSFTAEEIWQYFPEGSASETSVHLSAFPEVNDEYLDESLASRWDNIFEVRKEVSKALEIARNKKVIGHSLNAQVELYVSPKLFQILSKYTDNLQNIFIVSTVNLFSEEKAPADAYQSDQIKGLKIIVKQAEGEKCERCWIYSKTVGDNTTYPTICNRCVQVLS